MATDAYLPEFYDEQWRGAAASAQRLVPWLVDRLSPRSVVDVGCGVGAWLEQFRHAGVDDVLGLDGEWVAPEMLRIPVERFRVVDLRGRIVCERTFDLVMCLEVAEHLPADCAEQFLDSLVDLGAVILFSAAIPNQGGVGHVNEQWQEYWIDRFRDRGYVAVDCIRPLLWNAADVEFWYAQNTFLMIRRDRLASYAELATRQEVAALPVCAVHPRMQDLMQHRVDWLLRHMDEKLSAQGAEYEQRCAVMARRITELEACLAATVPRPRLLGLRRLAGRVPGARRTYHAGRRSLERLRARTGSRH